ncbi:MAG: prolyl oligopeptidase family serine peptidase [Candidatus Saccharicenans sp.]|nr:prolyl oligopeptidase family serine peptidase [Candidatus Saccharicenans sp.]
MAIRRKRSKFYPYLKFYLSLQVKLAFLLGLVFFIAMGNSALARGQETASSGPVSIRYNLEPGQVMTYLQNLDFQITLVDNPAAKFRVSLVWLVKTAVTSREGDRTNLVTQYNLKSKDIYGKKELEAILGQEEARNILLPYEQASPVYIWNFSTNDRGKILDGSYNFIQSFSFVNNSISQIFELPEGQLENGQVYEVEGEAGVKVNFLGETSRPPYDLYYFTGLHPAGLIIYLINKQLGVPDKLEYTVHYSAAGQNREEKFSLLLAGVQKNQLTELYKDPEIKVAVLKAALTDNNLPISTDLVQELLESKDTELEILAASACALRGLPPGLNLKPYLKTKKPEVRFNLAKALYLYGGDSGPMQELLTSSDSYLKDRAQAFLHKSNYVLADEDRQLYSTLRDWFYNSGQEIPPELKNLPVEKLRHLVSFLKPDGQRQNGFFKFFLSDSDEDRKRPYYLYLPDDYDPAENFPLIIYLGMGEGRGDLSLLSFYNALKLDNHLSRYILLVPQAFGRWWDKEVETAVKRTWRQVFNSYSLDTNRIYLAGSSNGGIGTIYYATSFPDRLAALAENMGFPMLKPNNFDLNSDLSKLGNLLNSEVLMTHGLADDNITPEGDKKAYDYLKKNDIEVYFKTFKEKKHNIDPADIIHLITGIFDRSVRNPFPARIKMILTDPPYLQSYWIKVTDYESLPAEVEAEVKHNDINLVTKNIKGLRLYLDETLIDLTQPVKIIINGQTGFQGWLEPSPDSLFLSLREKDDPAMGSCAILDLAMPD